MDQAFASQRGGTSVGLHRCANVTFFAFRGSVVLCGGGDSAPICQLGTVDSRGLEDAFGIPAFIATAEHVFVFYDSCSQRLV